jgi:hypothetical protein
MVGGSVLVVATRDAAVMQLVIHSCFLSSKAMTGSSKVGLYNQSSCQTPCIFTIVVYRCRCVCD